MRMEKRKFRIGELAQQLNVERFVIRFWEKEFNIKSYRSDGGQRFYSEDDLNTFKTVKELLYEKRFTIAGAKQMLKRGGLAPVVKESSIESPSSIIASQVTTFEQSQPQRESSPGAGTPGAGEPGRLPKDITKKLHDLRIKLVALKEQIS